MTDTVNAPETSTTAAPPEGPRGVWDYPAHPPADRPVDPTPSTTHTGWYFVGFTTEFTDTITGLRLAGCELMVVADGSGFRLFDAVCPHRGANLAVGGVLRGDCVTCPFHGKSVLLGRTVAPPRLGVSRYPLLVIGELMFARLADDPDGDRGFSAVMTQYLATHRFHAGTREPVSIDPQFIVENAFDTSHFTAVHHVPRADLMPAPASAGELVIDGYMEYAAPGWTGAQRGVRIRNRFHASAFSPTVVVTEVGDRPHQQLVVTGGLPTENGCEVLIGYGLTPDPGADDVDERRVEAMVKSGEIALAQDIPIWSNIDESVVPLYDVRDEPVRAFRRWCADFPRRTR